MTQSLAIDATLTDASWGIARVIRRDAPWPTPATSRLKFPWTTYFRAERDGTGVDLYLVDGLIRTSHSEITGRATMFYEPYPGEYGDGSFGSTTALGHGHRIACMAAGLTTGVARGALIWGAQYYGNSGAGGNPTTAIEEVLAHYNSRSGTGRPAVLNCSFTGTGSDINTAISDCIDAGIVVVAAAGNDGVDLSTVTRYPAKSVDAICVGGFGPADIPQYFSRDDGTLSVTAYGSEVDILAPGQWARSGEYTGDSDFVRSAGSTSAATAYTSGVVACMLQGHSRLTGRTQVQAVNAALLANATTGRLTAQPQFGIGTLPDRLLYLNPDTAAPESISGL